MKKILHYAGYLASAALSAAAAVWLPACTSDGDFMAANQPAVCPDCSLLIQPPTAPSAPISSVGQDVADAFNAFAVDFYLANSKASDENVCVSPIGVASVLGMLANGDAGASRDEILRLLGFDASDTGLEKMNTTFQTLTSAIPNIGGAECVFTNSCWGSPSIPMYQDFYSAVNGYFYARSFGIAPGGKYGMEVINEFVHLNTRGLIDDYLEEIPDCSLAFLNTAYFKGSWKYPFVRDLNETGRFGNLNGKNADVEYMRTLGMFDYAKTDDGTEAFRIPIGEDGSFSMTLILPTTMRNCPPELIFSEIFENDNLKQLDVGFESKPMQLVVPRFDVCMKNYKALDILKSMGIVNTCDPSAGFRNIVNYPDPFYLDEFIHAARIGITEEGTLGAAAAGSSIDENLNGMQERYFNSSFVFLIRETSTGVILFIGSVKNL